MKLTRIFCLVLSGIIMISLFFGPSSAAVSSNSVTAGCSSLKANMPLAGTNKLLESADSVILYELNSGTLVYSWNADHRINPSSTVKILTAYVALQHGNLEDIVTVRRATLDTIPIGSVSAGLLRDEEISVLDLLYCVMVSSANDAAAVLAEHIAGTQADYVALMNETALALGCTGSNFTNVTGLNDDNQYSTARDLAIITEAALQNELFSQMFCAETYTVAATNKSVERTVYTTNYMMSQLKIKNYYDARVTGGKTAAATSTSRSLICTAEVGNTRYLSIVMGADSIVSDDGLSVKYFGSFAETADLLDYGFENYGVRQILDGGQVYGQYPVSGGANDVCAAPAGNVFTVLPKEYDIALLSFSPSVDATALRAPLRKGDILGTLEVRYNGIVLTECELLAMYDVFLDGTDIKPAAPFVNEEQETDYRIWIILGIVVGVLILLALLVLLSLRLVRNARIRDRHRRRKRNRRRSR